MSETEGIIFAAGESVKLAGGITVVVHPVGFCHYVRFTAAVLGIARTIAETPLLATMTDEQCFAAITRRLEGAALADAFELFDACCVPRLSEMNPPHGLPHHLVPPLLQAWIRQSFRGNDLHPWMGLLDLVIRQAGKNPLLSIFPTRSLRSSAPGTGSMTSSVGGSAA